jgi:hypothetical protein
VARQARRRPRWVPLLEELSEARRVRWSLAVDPLEPF